VSLRVPDGVLFFPVTPFGRDGVDEAALARHVAAGLEHAPGAVFVACGTGELSALSVAEHAAAVRVAVGVVRGLTGDAVPVVAGAGGPLPVAREQVRQAADAGADGVLLLPPYLAEGPAAGLRAWAEAAVSAAEVPVILYGRANARYTPELVAELATHPLVAGYKDGTGDVDLVQRIVVALRRAGRDLLLFNGLPTAELTMPAYRGLGVHRYSSAVFAFLPELATVYAAALADGDDARVAELLEGFYEPFGALRDRVPGYAVALVKAGVSVRGVIDAGSVRPPLVDPSAADLAVLRRLVDQGLALAAR
jgi:5-dehydro-4-deoxyglucarate dehydratase